MRTIIAKDGIDQEFAWTCGGVPIPLEQAEFEMLVYLDGQHVHTIDTHHFTSERPGSFRLSVDPATTSTMMQGRDSVSFSIEATLPFSGRNRCCKGIIQTHEPQD